MTSIQVNDPVVITLEDPSLWSYPWIYIVEPGTLRLKDAEVPILREFLLRGGTLTFDDFHGPIEWANLEREMKRVFPDRKIVDLPSNHPIFSCFYQLDGFPADAGARLLPAGADLGKGRLRRHAARDRGRQRPRHGADQLEHRYGRRLGMVERGGVSRVREVHRAGVSHADQRDHLFVDALMNPFVHVRLTGHCGESPSAWRDGRERILTEIRKVIVGQDEVIDQVLMALFTGGHCLITGVPGLAKTLLIKTVAQILDLSFKRIQFTPDLMPADITGTEVLDEQDGHRSLRFMKGPIFAQILLADEINRTPPKTQAALLEAMQEYHVTAAGRTYPLDRPFFVLATQNPIELEGTYPLPEAQLDRFMFNVVMTYLSEDEEVRVVTNTTGVETAPPSRVFTRRRHPRDPAAGAAGRGGGGSRALRRAARGCLAPGTAERPSVRPRLGEVGRRAARVAVADPRRQGARAAERPLSRLGRRHPGARAAGAAPPRSSRTSTPSPSASPPTTSSSGCSRRFPRHAAECSDAVHAGRPRPALPRSRASSRGSGRWS